MESTARELAGVQNARGDIRRYRGILGLSAALETLGLSKAGNRWLAIAIQMS